MKNEKEKAAIKQLIYEGQIDQAFVLLDSLREQKGEDSDELWYLYGNAYRKKGETRQALNHYLRAIELNPDSPAQQAYNMLIHIMEFYDKNRYNH